MVQAAAKSGLDFTAANLRCRRWWTKARWVLDRIEDQNAARLFRMQHAQHLSVLEYGLEKQAFDTHWSSANDLLQQVHALDFPWNRDAGKKKRKRDIDALFDKWRSKFGDPNDPAVQARFKKVADAWRKQGAESSKDMFKQQRKLRNMVNTISSGRKKGK